MTVCTSCFIARHLHLSPGSPELGWNMFTAAFYNIRSCYLFMTIKTFHIYSFKPKLGAPHRDIS